MRKRNNLYSSSRLKGGIKSGITLLSALLLFFFSHGIVSIILFIVTILFSFLFLSELLPDVVLKRDSVGKMTLSYQNMIFPFLRRNIQSDEIDRILIVDKGVKNTFRNVGNYSNWERVRDIEVILKRKNKKKIVLLNHRLTKDELYNFTLIKSKKMYFKKLFEAYGLNVKIERQ